MCDGDMRAVGYLPDPAWYATYSINYCVMLSIVGHLLPTTTVMLRDIYAHNDLRVVDEAGLKEKNKSYLPEGQVPFGLPGSTWCPNNPGPQGDRVKELTNSSPSLSPHEAERRSRWAHLALGTSKSN